MIASIHDCASVRHYRSQSTIVAFKQLYLASNRMVPVTWVASVVMDYLGSVRALGD